MSDIRINTSLVAAAWASAASLPVQRRLSSVQSWGRDLGLFVNKRRRWSWIALAVMVALVVVRLLLPGWVTSYLHRKLDHMGSYNGQIASVDQIGRAWCGERGGQYV